MARTWTTKLAAAGGVAALALGAVGCAVDEDDPGLDPAVEDPILDDTTGGGDLGDM